VSAPSPGYRRLVLWTGVATFALILVGGVVRVSDSGLGCGPEGSGFNGWPFCNGDVVPGVDLNSIIEYTHRALAGVVGVMILVLAVQGWRRYRAHRPLVWAATAALALVIAQGALGGATVEEGLDERLVAAHLGLAMLLLGALLYAWRAASRQSPVASRQETGPGFRPLAVAATVAILATVVAGGYMAGTQNYGRSDYRLGDGAHHACGKEFPTCNGDFMPFGEARLVDIHLTHRALMYIATLLVVALVALALRRRPSPGVVHSARLMGALLLLQLVVGALNVWLDEYEALIVLHLALGTLLWASALGLTLQLYRVPAPAPAPARAEAVPA
jgi:heme a synthase